jgi:hypothetical protein
LKTLSESKKKKIADSGDGDVLIYNSTKQKKKMREEEKKVDIHIK